MNRTQLAPGIHITTLPGTQFKRCRITLQLTVPAKRSTATAAALLPLVMERGYADCPDMTQLSKHLARLYGAGLAVNSSMSGANRVFTVSVCGIKDEFALDGEDLTAAYTNLVLGVLLRPHLKNGLFCKEEMDVEKEQLRQALLSEMNDKRTYCLRQAQRRFFGDTPAGIEAGGYLEEIDAVTPQTLTAVYRDMLQNAAIEVVCTGANAQTVSTALQAALHIIVRTPCTPARPAAMPAQAEDAVNEPMDTEQGKLCMVFTGGQTPPLAQLPALRVAVAMFGGTATSRLFTNVREKQSLCYYCGARYAYNTAAMVVNSGIEHQNAARAKAAILAELHSLVNGEISAQELDDAKRSIVNSVLSVADSIGGTESWYLAEIERGTLQAPHEAAEAINAVTPQQAKAALASLSLSVSYCITKEEVAHA